MKSMRLDVPFIDQRGLFPTGCESVCAVMALRYLGVSITPDDFVDHCLPKGAAPHPAPDSAAWPIPGAAPGEAAHPALGNAPDAAANVAPGAPGILIGADPYVAFPGDPRREDGWGCFAPVIATACARALTCDASSGRLEAQELTGESPDALCESWVAKGIPVIFWATIEMRPTRTEAVWYAPAADPEIAPDAADPMTAARTTAQANTAPAIELPGAPGALRRIEWLTPEHCLLLVGMDAEYYYFNDPMAGKDVRYPKDAVRAAYAAMGSQAVVVRPRPN